MGLQRLSLGPVLRVTGHAGASSLPLCYLGLHVTFCALRPVAGCRMLELQAFKFASMAMLPTSRNGCRCTPARLASF